MRLDGGLVTPVNNAEATPLRECGTPGRPVSKAIIAGVGAGNRLAALFGRPLETRSIELFAVLAHPGTGGLSLLRTAVSEAYPSLTHRMSASPSVRARNRGAVGYTPRRSSVAQAGPRSAAHRLERRIAAGTVHSTDLQATRYSFFTMRGEEIHEVAVGPVHAGIIEPGHFPLSVPWRARLSTWKYLSDTSIAAMERALVGGPDQAYDSLCGNGGGGHFHWPRNGVLRGTGGPYRKRYSRARRGFARDCVGTRADSQPYRRSGALAGDIGYLPGASYCGRIRGDFLNLTALLCGSRFGRGLIRPGGTGFDVDLG